MTTPRGPEIAITGATGKVGGLVARALAERAHPPRLVVRDPSRAPQLPGATARAASYGDLEAMRTALSGARVLFLVSAAESATRREEHLTAVRAAAEAGVEHVVYLSFQGASPTSIFTLGRDHAATEEAIRASGMTWTFLRDSFYADVLPLFVDDEGRLRGPAREGRVAAVAVSDVADAATEVLHGLSGSAHVGAVYTLTGPQALTLTEVADTIGAVTGRTVTYVDETLPEAYASRERFGAPDWQVEAWVSTYTAIAEGEVSEVTGEVERLTGHPATPFVEVVRRMTT